MDPETDTLMFAVFWYHLVDMRKYGTQESTNQIGGVRNIKIITILM